MFAFNLNSRPVRILNQRVDLRAKVLGQRLTHGVGFHRGYGRFLDWQVHYE